MQENNPQIPLFDSHCHIDDKVYAKDLPAVLERAGNAGVRALMIAGVTLSTCKKAIDICKIHKQCFAAVGIHPHDAKSCSENVLEELARLSKNPVVKAWGETGLDFNRMYSPKNVQEKWFVRQIEMAGQFNLPIIIHERDTNGRLLDILSNACPDNITGVVHCFSGTKNELFSYLDLGFCIGVTGICTHKTRGKDLRGLLPKIPKNRLLIETDAPYLTPSPERNKHRRNEPAFVKSVLLKTAQVRQESSEELAKAVFDNTCRLYGIDTESLIK